MLKNAVEQIQKLKSEDVIFITPQFAKDLGTNVQYTFNRRIIDGKYWMISTGDEKVNLYLHPSDLQFLITSIVPCCSPKGDING